MKHPASVTAETQLLAEISEKLDRVIAVLAIQGKEKDKQIEILALTGLDSPFIASVIGTTSATVRTTDGWKRAKKAQVPIADVASSVALPSPRPNS